ncbi:nucleotidyltransferase family protein [Taibaiella koreensis]|uniref:nucleotidyltransferase family protein n=1 Tax=Taibaiella koreensis TaxID=1268548 RepID=UPI000E59B877|nr:nucleotidyltransferase family protein [Taibaiella koreensis]
MECIILAGGLGTRLSGVVSDVPKCMAPVAGQPFLAHVLQYLEQQHVDHVIFSLGYKSEVVIEYLRQKAYTFKTSWVLEPEPLGTGGGMRRALIKSKEAQVFILNGDTMFAVDLHSMKEAFDARHKAMLALKPMQDFERYGAVQLNAELDITAFEEKQFRKEGLINGGVYLLDKEKAGLAAFPEKFSFEKEFLEPEAGQGTLQGFVSDTYFIDIGIPEDYYKAQEDFKQ